MQRAGDGEELGSDYFAPDPDDDEVIQVPTRNARIMVSGEQRPYDVAVDLTIELQAVGSAQPGVLRTLHGFHRDVSLLCGFLADAADGPPNYSRGLTAQQVEDLMRRAASEWLAIDPTFDAVSHYFDRWLDWPESINRP